MSQMHQTQDEYSSLDDIPVPVHLDNPTLSIRQIVASRYVHQFDHVIELGGGELPIADYLVEFINQPKTYVSVDIRYSNQTGKKGNYTLIPIPLFPLGYRGLPGRHDDTGVAELERCKEQGGKIALVILGCSIRNGYDVLLDMVKECDRIVYEYRVGKDIITIKHLENDMIKCGFVQLISLRYTAINPEHDRHFMILDKFKA